jgi:predicted RNA-binding Zn-ribbon protein involved in translation (DUF1610 family)
MTDLEIFDKWHKTTIAQYSITENWQVGAIIEFAKYYHTQKLKSYNEAPECPKCGADDTKQSCIGKWDDGKEYRCDDCGNEFEFNHFA